MSTGLRGPQRSRRLLPVACCLVATSCATVSATSMQYVGAPRVPPSLPDSVEILTVAPARPHERLGEVSVVTSVRPGPATADVEATLRSKAGALGADAVIVVHDHLEPVGVQTLGAYATSWWWTERSVHAVTGRRLVGVAIRYLDRIDERSRR